MRDSGGGGVGLTNWSGSNVRDLWELVQDQETDGHWKLVGGWSRSAELTSVHLARVQHYRDNLALAWPPEKSPAAQAYIARLDQLVANLRETHEAAVANHTAMAGATGALQTSRAELRKLYEQYAANETRIQQYEQAKAAAAIPSTPTPSGTPSPSPGPSPVPGTPPVTPYQQEQLNLAARSVMYKLSSTLIEARAQIKHPTPYQLPRDRVDEERSSVGQGGSIPPIPPVVTLPATDQSTVSSLRPSTASPTGNSGVVTAPHISGPSLVGTGPIISPPVSPLPPSPSLGTPLSPVSNPAIIGLPPSPAPPGRKPVNSAEMRVASQNAPSTRPTGQGSGPGALRTGSTPNGSAAIRPMPPGGVIGQYQAPRAGHPGLASTPAGRANPVGGVIGSAGVHAASPFGQTSRKRLDDGATNRDWDPDRPWETQEGVEPVVLPPRDPKRIDPGPVIGTQW